MPEGTDQTWTTAEPAQGSAGALAELPQVFRTDVR